MRAAAKKAAKIEAQRIASEKALAEAEEAEQAKKEARRRERRVAKGLDPDAEDDEDDVAVDAEGNRVLTGEEAEEEADEDWEEEPMSDDDEDWEEVSKLESWGRLVRCCCMF